MPGLLPAPAMPVHKARRILRFNFVFLYSFSGTEISDNKKQKTGTNNAGNLLHKIDGKCALDSGKSTLHL
jgi:hypothetical protein